MANTYNYADDTSDVRTNLEDNLEVFKHKFLLFFIGLVGMAISIVIYAFGAGGWGSIPMLALVATWCVPNILKFWSSGFGSLFDFQYKVYEVYDNGEKKDVTTVGDSLTGVFLKFAVSLIVAVVSLYIVPAEIIVRLSRHMKFEDELGEKGTVSETPRKEVLLTVIVIVAMIVLATIGNAISTVMENTSDIDESQIVEIIERLESESSSYKIGEFRNGHLHVHAYVTQTNDTITFVVQETLMWDVRIDAGNHDKYTLNPGTYTYTDGAWVGVNENTAFILSKYSIGLAFDFDAMKNDTSKIVVNKDTGLGYHYDTEQHNYYELKPKPGSQMQFETIRIEENCTFATCSSGYNYIYIFAD